MRIPDGRRVFLVERSFRQPAGFRELVRRAAVAAGPDVETGVIVNLAQRPPSAAAAIVAQAGMDLAIADPSLHRHRALVPRQHPDRPDPWARDRRWLTGSLPTSPDGAFIDGVLNAQRRAGASLLLTPTGVVPESNGERELGRAMRWVLATRSVVTTDELAVNLTLARSWLTDDHLLEVLLNEMVDSGERIWYIRVHWGDFGPSGQLHDLRLLQGYAALARTAGQERKVLLLPQTSLVGWLALGFGAAGFATGTGGPEQFYAQRRQIRMAKGQRRQPIPRYFEPDILSVAAMRLHAGIAAVPGYAGCSCPYCRQMRPAGGGALDERTWTSEVAAQHQVVALARLAGLIPASSAPASVGAQVAAATAFADQVQPRLTGADRPEHLATWERLFQ